MHSLIFFPPEEVLPLKIVSNETVTMKQWGAQGQIPAKLGTAFGMFLLHLLTLNLNLALNLVFFFIKA
jgi:hypothetical protein